MGYIDDHHDEECLDNYLNKKSKRNSKKDDVELLKNHIVKHHSNDPELKRLYNEVLHSIKVNSMVEIWKKITPIE